MAYSEDGSEVLVLMGRSRAAMNAFGTLAWWPALGGKARPILDNAGWSDWAKKGHFLVVVREEGAARVLDVVEASGPKRRTLFRTAGAISDVRISPDEKEVAFIDHPSRRDDAGQVRIVRVDGSQSRILGSMFERCSGLDWNARTNEIWFTAGRGNIYNTTLWAMKRSGQLRAIYTFSDFFVLQDVGETGCLFVASSGGTNLILRKDGGAPRDFSWLGSTIVNDLSPDKKSVLFVDGTAAEKTLGTWVRPLDGGEALRISDGDPGKFSPDGRWVVGTSRHISGPPQLLLVPAIGGKTRQLTHDQAAYSDPSFAGSKELLFVRTENGRSEVWRMATDGTGARPLGVTGCSAPTAHPSGGSFLCLGGPEGRALLEYRRGASSPPRTIHELAGDVAFVYARWSESGDQIFVLTSDRKLLTVETSSGAIVREELIPFAEGVGDESLIAAAVSSDAKIQTYSISHFSSRLYMSRGF